MAFVACRGTPSPRTGRRTGRHRSIVVRCAVDLGLFKLSLVPVTKAALPLSSGILSVTEPRLVSLFQDLHNQQLQTPGAKMQFGHILSPAATPPGLMATEDAIIEGWPRVGCVAKVSSLQRRDDSTLLVDYNLSRRFSVLKVLTDREEPYPKAYATNYMDHSEGLSPLEKLDIDDAEQQVYRTLLSIEALSQKLQNDKDVQSMQALPEDIRRYAPPPPTTKSMAQALSEAGYAAGFDMLMWQSQGSMYGNSHGRSRSRNSGDPYAHVSAQLAKEQRQELFSFAAASLVDGLGSVECLALLNSQDTAARLRWVCKAISPYLLELQAKVSVMNALSN